MLIDTNRQQHFIRLCWVIEKEQSSVTEINRDIRGNKLIPTKGFGSVAWLTSMRQESAIKSGLR
ncbi:MAG: hypothetical protein HGA97_08925 [Chlorobiaceae bacterium]|nr:hypothetical protein [Chlorobiaceae bacterium]